MRAFRLLKNRWWRRALITIVVGGAGAVAHAVDRESDLAGLFAVVLFVWLGWLAFLGARWLWHRLTYRVGVRLFLSYLLIGLVPFPLLGGLGALAAFMVIGQYAAQRGGEVMLVWTSALFAPIRQDLEASGISFEMVKMWYAAFEPLNANPIHTDLEHIVLGRSLYDQINDISHYNLLADAWKLRNVISYKAGHLNVLRVPRLAVDVSTFATGIPTCNMAGIVMGGE